LSGEYESDPSPDGDRSTPSPTPPPAEPAKPLPGALAFAGMGMTIACTVGAGVVLGLLLDKHFGTSPVLLVVGLVLGCAAAVSAVAAQVKRYL
jgi:ATP synthase protein I